MSNTDNNTATAIWQDNAGNSLFVCAKHDNEASTDQVPAPWGNWRRNAALDTETTECGHPSHGGGDVNTATLYDYNTGDAIRPATLEELAASIEAAEHDGGAGVIEIDGQTVYAQ